MKQRDGSLDAIKGLACMMILAHATLSPQESLLVKNLAFFGGFAPTMFYAVSGVTITFQAKRNSFASIAPRATTQLY